MKSFVYLYLICTKRERDWILIVFRRSPSFRFELDDITLCIHIYAYNMDYVQWGIEK